MIRKLLFTSSLFFMLTSTKAQDSPVASLKESLWSAQATLFGLWLTNEVKLNDELVLRSQAELTGGYTQGYVTDYRFLYILIPEIELEPRWYHSIDRRAAKGRNISNNSADYISLKTTYQPDWFAIGNDRMEDLISSLALGANAGMRREIWDNFSFELAAGFGVAYDLKDQNTDDFFFYPDFHFNLGYSF